MRNVLSMFVVGSVLVLSSAVSASAQDIAARHTAGVTAGHVNFDLSGTGNAFGLGFRGARALTPHVAVELNAFLAWPQLQGGRAMLVAPEAHLQYHWRVGRFAPYAGGGIGFAHQSRDGSASATDVTLSTAGGVRAYLNDRVALLGEFRVRGFEFDFAGSTAEIIGGISVDLSR
jgi:hypothetical protein